MASQRCRPRPILGTEASPLDVPVRSQLTARPDTFVPVCESEVESPDPLCGVM